MKRMYFLNSVTHDDTQNGGVDGDVEDDVDGDDGDGEAADDGDTYTWHLA